MAYKNSGPLNEEDKFVLGTYEFEIRRRVEEIVVDDQTVTVTIISVSCKDGDSEEKRYARHVIRGDVGIQNWRIEANDTTADVYATVQIPGRTKDATSDLETNWDQPIIVIPRGTEILFGPSQYGDYDKIKFSTDVVLYRSSMTGSHSKGVCYCAFGHEDLTEYILYNKSWRTSWGQVEPETWQTATYPVSLSVTIDGKTAKRSIYYRGFTTDYDWNNADIINQTSDNPDNNTIWSCVYGTISSGYTEEDVLVGRFAIDLHEAGGTGTGSTWYDPGDWNSNPSTVLNLTVNGALSGRHNDPLNQNADYSYTPADQHKATGYGCGGDGGHGGGGGAGASTIVVNKFATDRANSKNIVTKPKRHGYGSGGGKGGEGGDGCILIFY